MNAIVLESVLTCPNCGVIKQELMPTDACQFYYECTNCKTLFASAARRLLRILLLRLGQVPADPAATELLLISP